MKNIYFTVGPSQVYPGLERYINQAIAEEVPSMSHRGTMFHKLYAETISRLKKLYKIPAGYHIFFLSSATEAMERIIENCVEKQSFHVVSGAFSKKFYEYAVQLGKKATAVNIDLKNPDLKKIAVPKNAELIAITQNETSNGFMIPMKYIYAFKKQNPRLLVAIDIVSSAPYTDIDFSLIDCAFFSVQKGFGLPAGLAVLIVGPIAFNKSRSITERGVSIGSFHSFTNLESFASHNETPETPNVMNLYLLNKVLQLMLKKSLRTIRRETETKANYVYTFMKGNKTYLPAVYAEEFQSKTVIVTDITGGSKNLIKALKKKKLIMGSGYGDKKDSQIRIANFPTQSLSDVKRLITVLKIE